MGESAVSNMHNVFVSPEGATAIDMAIGGASSHSSIRADGSGGQPLHNWAPYLLNSLLSEGKCTRGMDLAGAEPFEHHLGLKLQMPYFNGDIHKHAFECHVQNGSAIERSTASRAAQKITALIPGHLAGFLKDIDEAIESSQAKLSVFAQPGEIADITGWLKHRVARLRLSEQKALATCGVDIDDEAVSDHHQRPVWPESFQDHGGKTIALVRKCIGLRIDQGLGMCCVKSCHHSKTSRLGCLKICQDLLTKH